MAFSMLTLLEMLTNPGDLVVAVGQRNGKFAFVVCRGPGHNYKLLLSTSGIFESRQEAVDSIRRLLLFVIEKGTEILNDRTDPVAQIINPDNKPIADMKILTRQTIDALIGALADADEVKTF